MCVECNYCRQVLRGILIPLSLWPTQAPVPGVQSSNSNTKVSRGQVHSLRGRPGALVFAWVVGRCSFIPQNIKTTARFNSAQTDWRFYYCRLYFEKEHGGHYSITWCCRTSILWAASYEYLIRWRKPFHSQSPYASTVLARHYAPPFLPIRFSYKYGGGL